MYNTVYIFVSNALDQIMEINHFITLSGILFANLANCTMANKKRLHDVHGEKL